MEDPIAITLELQPDIRRVLLYFPPSGRLGRADCSQGESAHLVGFELGPAAHDGFGHRAVSSSARRAPTRRMLPAANTGSLMRSRPD